MAAHLVTIGPDANTTFVDAPEFLRCPAVGTNRVWKIPEPGEFGIPGLEAVDAHVHVSAFGNLNTHTITIERAVDSAVICVIGPNTTGSLYSANITWDVATGWSIFDGRFVP